MKTVSCILSGFCCCFRSEGKSGVPLIPSWSEAEVLFHRFYLAVLLFFLVQKMSLETCSLMHGLFRIVLFNYQVFEDSFTFLLLISSLILLCSENTLLYIDPFTFIKSSCMTQDIVTIEHFTLHFPIPFTYHTPFHITSKVPLPAFHSCLLGNTCSDLIIV